ncbi:MAG: Bug family tripartite tricarboxylate transporter substrate binding protein [Stellaceae bacterium]
MRSVDRRAFLQLTAGIGATVGLPRFASARDYPVRPVRIVVGYAAGGTADVTARLVGQLLSERLGQQFIVENRPGAGSNLAAEEVVHARPDGYTLLLASGANAINATLYKKLDFDFERDITAVAGIIRVPNVMVVSPSFPAETIGEFIAYAKAHPGMINVATLGNGSPQQVFGSLFEMMAGVKLVHVPYRGGAQAVTALLGGQVQVFFGATTVMIGYIKAGRVRGLAVTTAQRVDALPGVPAMAEAVPGYKAADWLGLGAPKATPRHIVDLLNNAVNAGLADPKIKQRLSAQGSILKGSPGDFGKLIRSETQKWAKVIQAGDIKSE